jgi:hypothetical protein
LKLSLRPLFGAVLLLAAMLIAVETSGGKIAKLV